MNNLSALTLDLPYRITPAIEDDKRYVVSTWLTSYHRSPSQYKTRYVGNYNQLVRPTVQRLVDTESVLTAKTAGDRIVGWLVYTPGRSISTVHYAYTRHHLDDVEWRKRGVLLSLLEAAGVGRRFLYTHKGEFKRGGYDDRRRFARPLDEEIVSALQRRGVVAAYEPYKEWAKP